MPFIADRSASFVKESRGGQSVTRIPGRFSICDSVNGNNRRYPKKVWEKNLAEGSPLRQIIAKNAAFGLLEHPDDGQVTLNSPICILVTDAKLHENKSVTEVVGEITILGTPEGQKLSVLIEAGYNPLVSSRGFGSVTKAADGVDDVQDDYVCEGWDVVFKPSFENAELMPERDRQESVTTTPATASLTEAATATSVPAAPTASLSTPPAAPAAQTESVTTKPVAKQLTETMDINIIKSNIGNLRNAAIPSDPRQFAAGLNEMAQLHQQVAEFVAEDVKRSWQGQQMHETLKEIEASWAAKAQAPTKQATALSEGFRKALRVTKVLGETAVGLKKKLVEAKTNLDTSTKLVEAVTTRGKKWMALAEKYKDQAASLDRKLDTACEALEIMADRYKSELTESNRKLLQLEFKDKLAADKPLQEQLLAAKHPKDVAAIREKLDPGAKEKEKAGKLAESKAPTAAPAPAAPAASTTTTTTTTVSTASPAPAASVRIVERTFVNPLSSVAESAALVRRLAAAAK